MQDRYCCVEFVPVMGLDTHVTKFGLLHQPTGEKRTSQLLFLIVPGNPGIIQFYEKFMETLYKASDKQIPVWGVSHTGHVISPSQRNQQEPSTNQHNFSLQKQIRYKLAFIKDNIPQNVKLILIGHSIGCYIILKMMPQLHDHQVLRCFLLFPTIERIAASPKGRVATVLLKYLRWVALLFMYVLSFLSYELQYRLILWYFKDHEIPECAYNASMNLFDVCCVDNITRMAAEEMQIVMDLDENVIKTFVGKLSFYYGCDDKWCPMTYCEEMRERFPHADIREDHEGYKHAFILDSSDEMAYIVWKWLQSDLKKMTD